MPTPPLSVPDQKPPVPAPSISPAPGPSYSPKRAIKHALFALLVVIVIGGVLAVVLDVADPEKFGQGIGRFGVFVMIVAYAVSYFVQRGRRTIAWSIGLGLVVLIASAAFVVATERGAPALLAADRAPLFEYDEGGQRRLRHPSLFFSIAHPGASFVESSQLTAVFEDATTYETNHYYAYADADEGVNLVISVASHTGRRDDFVDYIDGVQRGITNAARGKATVVVREKRITWTDGRREARFHGVIDGTGHMRLRAFAITPAGHAPIVVLLMVISSDETALASLLDGFRP